MKKIMFGILFLAVVMISGCELMQEEDPQLAAQIKDIGGGSGGSPVPACYDSDSGLNYGVKGTIYVNGQYHQEDKCTSPYDGSVIEWYCDGSMQMVRSFDCSYGCTDGACDDERYSGVIKLLNGAQILSMSDCTTSSDASDLFLCNSCDEICASNGLECIYGHRSQYNEEYNGTSFALPDYSEPYECGLETSPIQFKLYCGCV